MSVRRVEHLVFPRVVVILIFWCIVEVLVIMVRCLLLGSADLFVCPVSAPLQINGLRPAQEPKLDLFSASLKWFGASLWRNDEPRPSIVVPVSSVIQINSNDCDSINLVTHLASCKSDLPGRLHRVRGNYWKRRCGVQISSSFVVARGPEMRAR